MSIYQELEWRGLLSACTHADELKRRLSQSSITLYCGFDPTADSLHVGSLVPLLALQRFQKAGHHPIAVAGGATGSIGDPSGKTQERQLLTREQIGANVAAVRKQMERFLDFDSKVNPARLVDNADWICPLSFIDFLRDVGKHFTVNHMMAKESIRARLEDRDVGISYTEFSYMLLQAYDFCHLYEHYGCELQVGGSDQWGNITAGMELVRRALGKPSYGLTFPLIQKADGTKFGKTESGTIWLDASKTSVYRFYQFWLNTDDRDVGKYLRYFTLMEPATIEALEAAHAVDPGKRQAHRALAEAVTEIVHGRAAVADAARASEVLFGGSIMGITEALLEDIVSEVPKKDFSISRFALPGMTIVDLLAESGLSHSKGQARKDVEGGGTYLNNVRVADITRSVTTEDLLYGRYLLLRKGKKSYLVANVQ